ncbi:MAG: hypothetical protein KF814_11220 [Nitrospiraceae bacterium]|mgnify:CR=1 FL=1|nr:hypothetical protein [Nitrospiraceae bacterium]
MSAQDQMNAYLDDLSRALLRLHKALLDAERVSYERVHGRIASNGEFLQLVLGDAWFAWLRPLSRLMARIDELAEGVQAVSDEEITALLRSTKTMLTPSEAGDGFGRQYYEALQQWPDVGLAHSVVTGLLRSQGTRKGESSC